MTWSSAPVSIRDYARRTFDRPLPLHTKLALVWVKVLATCGYELGRCRPARSRGPAQSAVRVVSYRPTTPPPTPPPDGESVAVVIPALLTSRTHRACLGRALDALAAQSPRAPDWVIVVDDGSPKPIPAADVASRVPPAVGFALLRVEPNAGPAAARNAGLAAAADRGATLVAFMDADVSPRPGWLAAHVAAQAAPGRRGLVAGLTLARRGRGPAAIVARFHDETGTLNGRLLADSQQPHQRAQQQLPSMLYACTCNLSLALMPGRGGGGSSSASRGDRPPPSFGTLSFDPAFRAAAYEDIDLCLRAVKPPYNLPLTFAPSAVAEHTYNTCAFGVASQFKRYGMHERLFTRKHPTYMARLAASVAIVAGSGQATQAAS